MAGTADIRIFGVRHHGPGSARSLRRALEAMGPDVVLVEGPPDADDILAFATHEEMRPPVAILIYDPVSPQRAVFYPFAVFSPEWQAIQWATKRNVPVRFMDLPQWHQMAQGDAATPPEAPADSPDAPSDPPAAEPADQPESDVAVREYAELSTLR